MGKNEKSQEKDEKLAHLYAVLEKVRNDRGLSKKAFSEQAGMAQNWYVQCLSQKRDVGYFELARLIKTYKIDPGELFGKGE